MQGEKGNIKPSSIATSAIAKTLLPTNGCNHTSVEQQRPTWEEAAKGPTKKTTGPTPHTYIHTYLPTYLHTYICIRPYPPFPKVSPNHRGRQDIPCGERRGGRIVDRIYMVLHVDVHVPKYPFHLINIIIN